MLGLKTKEHSTTKQNDLELVKNQVSVLLLHAPHPTLLLDPHYNTTAFNEAAARLIHECFGWKLVVGGPFLPLYKLVPGHPIAEFLNLATHGLSTNQNLDCNNIHGERIQLQLSCTPLPDKSGNLQSFYLSIQDRTETTPASLQEKNLQDFVNAVYHSADIGIAIIDENGYFLKTNDGYNDLFGFANGELDGKHYTIIIPQEDLHYSQKKFKAYLNGQAADEERQVIKKNGEYFTIFHTARLLQNADNSKSIVITARDLSETRLYQQIFSNTEKTNHMAGWEMDVATKRITCTSEMFNILDIQQDEFIQLSNEELLERFLEKNEHHIALAAIATALQKGKPFNLEIPILTSAQTRKWLSITCTPERFKSHIIRLLGTVQDITQRKSNEFELERLSLVASKTSNAVFITDKNAKTIWLNESVQKMTGYRLADFLGKKPGEVLHGKDTDKATVSRISKAIKARHPVSEIILYYKKDGTPIWINMDIAPIFKDGALENFIGIGVDITELVKTRELQKIKEGLEQQQKLFTAITNNFPDGIIGLLDKNLVYIFAGGIEIKKLGLTVKDFIGKKIFNHLTNNNDKQATIQLKKALAGESVAFEVTINSETYSVNAVPARLGDNAEKHILVVLYNITLNKKAEFDLMETLKKEKELGELKTRFVSMASHEFRTPLSTVLSSAYLIEKYIRAEEQPNRQKHLRRIVSSVETLTEILEDFLSLGKIEEGKIQVRLSCFNISNLVAITINEMEHTLRPKQQIQYWHHGEMEVNMDQSLLKHILMNLISNASKFSPEGSKIEITTFQDEYQVIVTVKDQGMGISNNDQQHLMERFFRGANAGNIQGTGLGLHIISKYAELMQGTVVCTSELEKGTTFTITFYTKLNHDEKNPAD